MLDIPALRRKLRSIQSKTDRLLDESRQSQSAEFWQAVAEEVALRHVFDMRKENPIEQIEHIQQRVLHRKINLVCLVCKASHDIDTNQPVHKIDSEFDAFNDVHRHGQPER